MRRFLIVIAGTAVLMMLVVKAQDGYQLVVDWAQMPEGYVMGYPGGAPLPEEREALRQSGNRPRGISAFAGVAVDHQDNVYAFHRGQEDLTERFPANLRTRKHPVVVFDSEGNFLRWAGDGIEGGVLAPHMLEIDPEGHLWIIERDDHRVLKLDKDGHGIAMAFGERGVSGDDPMHLNRPTDVAWSSNGDIFITDGYGNHRVLKFTKDGEFIEQWGGGPESEGSGDGEFHLPHSISIDWQDTVYVLDRENHRVQIFDTDGNFLRKWDVCNCWGITIKKDGGRDRFMYGSDHAAEQVIKISMADGSIVARWGGGPGQEPGQFDWVHDIAVDSMGAVYTSETYGNRVQKFVDGKLAAILGGRGSTQLAWVPFPRTPPTLPLLGQPVVTDD